MSEKNKVTWNELEYMAVEALDGIEYPQLKRVLKVLRPDIKVTYVKGDMEHFWIEEINKRGPHDPDY